MDGARQMEGEGRQHPGEVWVGRPIAERKIVAVEGMIYAHGYGR